MTLLKHKVFVSDSTLPGAGLGVFAAESFLCGDTIEICKAIPLVSVPDNTGLWNHQVAWTEECDAILTGAGLLYNHSDFPNVEMIKNFDSNLVYVRALRTISYGEELFVKYACPPWWGSENS